MLLSLALIAAAAAPAKPNVVLIVADDLGWADLGCYGSKYHRTPNLDALAKGGMRFTHAYAPAPVCSPTRAALMTGQHPARLHLTDWLPGRGVMPDQKLLRPTIRSELPKDVPTIAERFKANGYATGLVGKWHLGGAGHGPTDRGFGVNIGGDHTGTPLSYLAPYAKKGRSMPGLETAPAGEYLTDRLGREAAGFIAANKSKPFFLYCPHYAPHTPLVPDPAVLAKYPGQPQHGKQSNPKYAAMIESLDAAVGTVLAALKENAVGDTIVVFTSDNGGLATLEGMPFAPTINAPLREGKGYLYEGGLRVPLIVSTPGGKPGTTDAVASLTDLFPTLLTAAGIAPPTNDGVDLAPVLAGTAKPDRTLYWHYPHYANQGGKPGGAVRDGNWKYVEHYETGRGELFDVVADGSESRNRATEKPAVTAALKAKLAAWRTDVAAQMPMSNEKYLPHPQAADGSILLPARGASVTGVQLRFEPLPHKNCLGFWTNADDTASWEFTVTKPGTFDVVVSQGCGTGNGGSAAYICVGESKFEFVVDDTGGFQKFVEKGVGRITVEKPGRHTLLVGATKKAKAAVMDVQKIVLKPAK